MHNSHAQTLALKAPSGVLCFLSLVLGQFCFFAVHFYILPLRQGFWSLCLQYKILIEFACRYFDPGWRGVATVSTVTSQQKGKKKKVWGFAKKNKQTNNSVHLNF